MSEHAESIKIDVTWGGVWRIFAEAYANGTPEGRKAASEEFSRMARLADSVQELRDRLEEAEACAVKPPRKRGRPRKQLPEGWDWSLSDIELSRKHQWDVQSIRQRRKRERRPPVAPPASRRMEARKLWDWSKQDVDLARENGLTRERVRQIRAQLGHPPCSQRFNSAAQRFKDWLGDRKVIQLNDAVRAGFHEHSVRRHCSTLGVRIKKLRYKWPWDLVNWELSNGAISEAWGISLAVVACRRRALGQRKSPHIKMTELAAMPSFASECEKANEWRAEQ